MNIKHLFVVFVVIGGPRTEAKVDLSVYSGWLPEVLVDPLLINVPGPAFIHVSSILVELEYNSTTPELPKILQHFQNFTRSLLAASEGTPLHLIFVTDNKSSIVIRRLLIQELGRFISLGVISNTNKNKIPFPRLEVNFVDFGAFLKDNQEEIDEFKDIFCPTEEFKLSKKVDEGVIEFFVNCEQKYRKDLFYLATYYHKMFPDTIEQLIVLDIDLKFSIDLKVLQNQFLRMDERSVFGVAKEFSMVYKMMTTEYRDLSPESLVGTVGTNQGLNTGIVLMDLKKLRGSQQAQTAISSQSAANLANKYRFKGRHGDQDLFTLLSWGIPELIYVLPCQFNVQNRRLLMEPTPQQLQEKKQQQQLELAKQQQKQRIAKQSEVSDNDAAAAAVAAAAAADDDDEYEDADFISLIMGGEPEWDQYRSCPGRILIEHFNGSI